MNSSVATTHRTRSHLSARGRRVFQVLSQIARQLGPDHIRQYQAYLFRGAQAPSRDDCIAHCGSAFSLRQDAAPPVSARAHPISQAPKAIARCLSPEEVERLIDSAENLMRRTMVMTLYSTGHPPVRTVHLKVSDIDSQRMVIHIHKGKGGRDRDVL